jgi:NADH-ubiquinone oxidoreductase chain 2
LIFIKLIFILTIFILSINSVFILKNININSEKKNYLINNIIKNYMSEQYRIIEYPLIILFCIIGAIFLMLSFDIVSIFLSIELQSYALYLICSIYRNSESSVSAGLTYFLLGGLSSCLILLGISLLYMNSGNTSLENIYILNNISDIYTYDLIYNNTLLTSMSSIEYISSINIQYIYLQISLVIMSIGFLFKISAAPFHF